MIEPSHIDTTGAQLALPSDNLSPAEKEAQFEVSMRLLEIAIYEQAAAEIERNPGYAYRICAVQSAPQYPAIRREIMARAFETMNRQPAAKRPGGADDQARAEAFRKNPGLYLKGASPDRVVSMHPPLIDFIYVDGHTFPWTFVSDVYARSDVADLIAYREKIDFPRAYAIGKPGLDRTMRFPAGVIFVPVALQGEAA